MGLGTRSRGSQAQAPAGPPTLGQAAVPRPLLVPAWPMLVWRTRRRMWALEPWVSPALNPRTRCPPCQPLRRGACLCTQLCTVWWLAAARVSSPACHSSHAAALHLLCRAAVTLLPVWHQQTSLG